MVSEARRIGGCGERSARSPSLQVICQGAWRAMPDVKGMVGPVPWERVAVIVEDRDESGRMVRMQGWVM
jgi:hypothetical protein